MQLRWQRVVALLTIEKFHQLQMESTMQCPRTKNCKLRCLGWQMQALSRKVVADIL